MSSIHRTTTNTAAPTPAKMTRPAGKQGGDAPSTTPADTVTLETDTNTNYNHSSASHVNVLGTMRQWSDREACEAPLPTAPIADSEFKREHELLRRSIHGGSPETKTYPGWDTDDLQTRMALTDPNSFQDNVNLDTAYAKLQGKPYWDGSRIATAQVRAPAPTKPAYQAYVDELDRFAAMHRAGCAPQPNTDLMM